MAQSSVKETMSEAQRAQALIKMLPPAQLAAVVGLLEVILNPVARSIADAPIEEEEITDETAAEIDQARESLARGEGIPHDEILREFGLKK